VYPKSEPNWAPFPETGYHQLRRFEETYSDQTSFKEYVKHEKQSKAQVRQNPKLGVKLS
jgi:hypothetical protein